MKTPTKTPKNQSPQTKPIAKSAALPNVDGGKTVVSSNGAQGQSADTNIFPEEVYGHYINGRKFNRAHSQEEMDASRVGEGLSSKKKTRSDTQTSDDEILKEAYDYYNGCDTKTALKKAIALTREDCEEEFEKVKGAMEWATKDIKKAERERILEMMKKLENDISFPDYDSIWKELKKEIEK